MALAAVHLVRQCERHFTAPLRIGRAAFVHQNLPVDNRFDPKRRIGQHTSLGTQDRQPGHHLVAGTIAFAVEDQPFSESGGRQIPHGQRVGHFGKTSCRAAGYHSIDAIWQVVRQVQLAVAHAVFRHRLTRCPLQHVASIIGDLDHHGDFAFNLQIVAGQRHRSETNRLAGVTADRLVQAQMRDQFGRIDDKRVRERCADRIARRPDLQPHHPVDHRGRCLEL
jgi:hypothetical protein